MQPSFFRWRRLLRWDNLRSRKAEVIWRRPGRAPQARPRMAPDEERSAADSGRLQVRRWERASQSLPSHRQYTRNKTVHTFSRNPDYVLKALKRNSRDRQRLRRRMEAR